MKKLVLVFGMLVMTFMASIGVLAEGEAVIEEVVEPSTFDNWVAVISDFASLKNFIVSAGGLATLAALGKLRGVYKFLKSPNGLIAIESMFVNVLGKVTEKPELVLKIVKIVATMPVIENILNKAEARAGMYEIELQGKILDMEARIQNKVYEGEALNEAQLHLTKLREQYETNTTN